MAITNICGFETGAGAGADNETTLTGGATIQTTTKRTGDYALKALPVTTGSAYAQIATGHAATGVSEPSTGPVAAYYRFYLYITTLPSAAESVFSGLNVSAALKFELRLDQNAKLSAFDSALNSLGTGATTLSTSTWYRIGVRIGTGAAGTGVWEVQIDGTSELSGTTASLGTLNNRLCRIGKNVDRNGSGYEVYFDDFAISNSAFPNAGAVACIRPTGNGNYTAWTGTYTDVDDIPHDTDTTYISSSTNTQAETVTLENCSDRGISGTINAVKSVTIMRDVSNTTNAQHRVRVTSPGTADTDLSLYDNAATYVLLAKVMDVNPSGSAAWDSAGVDSLEVGIVHSQSNARELRCTMICAMVDYTEAEGPAADIPPQPTIKLIAVPRSFNW